MSAREEEPPLPLAVVLTSEFGNQRLRFAIEALIVERDGAARAARPFEEGILKTVSKLLAGGAAALAIAAAAAPAFAQGISIGPGGVQLDPGGRRGYDDRGPPRSELSRGEATRIARREGLVDVDGVDRRGPRMIVRGSDRRGDDMTVVLDSRSGDVIDVRR